MSEPISRWRKITAVVVFFAAAFVMVSIISFDAGDAPSTANYPNNVPPENICGSVGAYLSYYLIAYVGRGAYPLALFVFAAAFLFISQKSVEDKVFRSVGAVLLVAASSAAMSYMEYLRGTSRAPLPQGYGGYLGRAVVQFITAYLGNFGAGLFLAAVIIVGLTLLTDTWLIIIPVAIFKWVRARLAKRSKAAIVPTSRLAQPRAEPVAVAKQRPAETEPPKREEQPKVKQPVQIRMPEKPKVDAKRLVTVATPKSPKRSEDYQVPSLDLFEDPEHRDTAGHEETIRGNAEVLEKTLRDFGLEGHVVAIDTGPVITQYELSLAPGIKVGKVIGLSDDIAIALKAPNVRVVAPLPGKGTVGVEVPNVDKDIVRIKEVVLEAPDAAERLRIPLFLGKDAAGVPLVKDLAQMPHLLIAGTTGSGKSVCLNTIIMSILLTRTPDDVKLLLIDPKMVELTQYRQLPHLICPVVNDMRKAEAILDWLVNKMDERYTLLAEVGARNIAGYNRLSRETLIERFKPASPEEESRIMFHMPHIVVIIDELADLMMIAAKEVEHYVTRLSQKSRAVGIHLVMATQRPSVDVLTGLIKSNLPIRISFQTASRIDSRTILDSMGAEKLLSRGDMLFMEPGAPKLIRAQGAFVNEKEVQRVLDFVTKKAEPQFQHELVKLKPKTSGESEQETTADLSSEERDPLYEEAVRIVLENERGSVSLLQRRMGIGYGRAARLIDYMAEDGIVGDYAGSQARQTLITVEEWEAIKAEAKG